MHHIWITDSLLWDSFFLFPVTDIACCNPSSSRQFQLAHVLLLHYVKNSFPDNHVCSSVMFYIRICRFYFRLYGRSIMP